MNSPSAPDPYPRVRRERRPRTRRVALKLAYDGTAFHGFQRQPGQRTVEGALVEALGAMGHGGGLGFASRTDTGVHASGQVLALRIPETTGIDDFARTFTDRLPSDLRLVAAAAAPPSFHPRWSALGKRYEYRLADRPGVPRAWLVEGLEPERLDQALAQVRAAPSLAGFTAAGAPQKDAPPLGRLERITEGGVHTLVVEGPAFRRYAIRHLVGCAVAEALGQEERGACTRVAASPPPYRGLRAPGDGLTLVAVHYPPALDPFHGEANNHY